MENVKKAEIEDVDEPNLLRGMFPYSEVPKIKFEEKIVPINTPEDFWITDTTFRDGQQARPPYSVKQIADIYTLLHKLGGPNGVIRQSEFFLYSKKDKEAVKKCLKLGYKYPEVTGWIRAVEKDFQLVKEMGLKETGILTSLSDYHIFLKLGIKRKDAAEKYLKIVRAAIDAEVLPRCHFEDVTRADINGFVVPFAQKLMELQEESGMPIKIRLCDTMGYGVPFVHATLPRSVPKLIHAMTNGAGVPPEQLEWHGHNDFHKVLVNGTVAWLYGCAAVNGTLLGFGERTGNSPIEGLCVDYASLKGSDGGMDLSAITEIARYFKEHLDVKIPANYPFVGADFNTTRAGIHADGAIKNEEIYNIFDTTKILNRPLEVTITDKSGTAGIAFWINKRLGLKNGREIDKKDPRLQRIADWIANEYAEGRITSISDDEMLDQAKINLPECFESDFDKLEGKADKVGKELVEDLAGYEDMATMSPELIEPLLDEFVKKYPYIQLVYVVTKEGRKITRNITQPKDRGKYAEFGTNENFSNRDWFIRPMQGIDAYVTDVFTSKITKELIITVSAPIKDDKNEIKGIIGIDLKFEDLLKME